MNIVWHTFNIITHDKLTLQTKLRIKKLVKISKVIKINKKQLQTMKQIMNWYFKYEIISLKRNLKEKIMNNFDLTAKRTSL
jgi:hypothetical protein